MEVTLSETVPTKYAKMKGTVYETRYVYTGFGRFNEHEKTLEVFQREEDGRTTFFTRPYVLSVVSRVYHVEYARVTLYSVEPRVWSEDVGGSVSFFSSNQTSSLRPQQG